MVVDIFGVIVAIVLGSILYYYFSFIDNLMDKVLGNEQVLYYRKDNNSLDSIPHNAKSKTTTKKRWAKSTHQVPNDSFASAIMWGDLGND